MKNKSLFIFILLFMVPVDCSKRFDIQNHLNQIKHKVVTHLPEQWQRNGEKYFWPFVGACAAVICVAVLSYCNRQYSQDSRDIFTDMLTKMFGQNVPADMKLNNGDHWGNLHILYDNSGAIIRLGKEDRQLCAPMLSIPLDSSSNPNIGEIVDATMSQLARIS
jgi:hypothetical protein